MPSTTFQVQVLTAPNDTVFRSVTVNGSAYNYFYDGLTVPTAASTSR